MAAHVTTRAPATRHMRSSPVSSSRAAAAATAVNWREDARGKQLLAASTKAEEAARQKAERLAVAQRAADAAAADAQLLEQSLRGFAEDSMGVSSSSRHMQVAPVKNRPQIAHQAAAGSGTVSVTMPAPPGVVPSTDPRQVFQLRSSSIATAATPACLAPSVSGTSTTNGTIPARASACLNPPGVAPSSSGLHSRSVAAAAVRLDPLGVGPSSMQPAGVRHTPPAVVLPRSSSSTGISTARLAQAIPLNPPAVVLSSSGMSAVLSADVCMCTSGEITTTAVDPAAMDADGVASGMQLLSAVVGCAAVGTVMWSEFVLKDTGCGLPPGPYGLLGAAEGLSYLAVLGFAGAGVAARGASGGKQGLPGALVVPEVMAYAAVAAGLIVLASQLQQFGYAPPVVTLPEVQSYQDAVQTYADAAQLYPDAGVTLPAGMSTDDPSAQLSTQLADLQAILGQIKSAAADGVDQLALQEQLEALQLQLDSFSAYVAAQTKSIGASVQVEMMQLQDSLSSVATAVSSFVDAQLQQLDIPGKLASVLDVLRKQEQMLVVELPKQFAELQRVAGTSISILQETTVQASTAAHLPELLAALDSSMGVLHDVLELRIQQLDVVLTQLHDSCAAAAGQLAAAAAAAEQAGSAEAAAQLASLQQMLSTMIASVQEQVWAGYQQLALADHFSEALLQIRMSAAEAAATATAELDKLQLEKQLSELEAIADASLSALAASAMDQLAKLELEQKFVEIESQAAAAAESLQAGLVQQYNQQLPVLQEQLSQLQDNLADLAAGAQQGLVYESTHAGPELEALLLQLQQSMEATVKVVAEVASSSADVASQQLQTASSNIGSNLGRVSGSLADYVSNTVGSAVDNTAVPAVPEAVQYVAEGATALPGSGLDTGIVASAPYEVISESWVIKPFTFDLTDAPAAAKTIWANRPQ